MTSTITGTAEIFCKRNGYKFIPAHEYLNGLPIGVPDVPFTWGKVEKKGKLRPDSVFAIDYGNNSIITYFLENDRNTETVRATDPDQKSDLRSIRQYRNFIGGELYKDAYKRKSKAVLLYITVNAGHAQNVYELIGEEMGKCSYIAIGWEEAFEAPFHPPKLPLHLFEGPLPRAGLPPWTIKKETTP
jgi:hypothetical protein